MERERKTVRFLRLINPNLKNLENWKSFAVPELKFLDRREKSLKKKEREKGRTKMEGRFDDESRRAIGTRARPITSERKDRKRERESWTGGQGRKIDAFVITNGSIDGRPRQSRTLSLSLFNLSVWFFILSPFSPSSRYVRTLWPATFSSPPLSSPETENYYWKGNWNSWTWDRLNFQEKRGGDGYRADTDFQKKGTKIILFFPGHPNKYFKILGRTKYFEDILRGRKKKRERKKKDLFLTAVESG